MVSEITKRAIKRFESVEKNLLYADHNGRVLNELITKIPAEEMTFYLAETARILEKYQRERERMNL